jgi:phospholipid/cholesterol/gamma-HCH transport system ATP-binding protein
VEHGTPESINHSSSEWVQQFMGGLADGPVPFHYSNTPLMDDLMPQGKRGEA